ncbi:MAG: hypothetical protein ONB37_08585 [candidate division KSB1 bacterium]|nr:hypothetical protein [candidate division KSB1 bacterium]
MVFICLSSLSLLVSMTGLFILLFASFASDESETPKDGFINRQARKIRIHKEAAPPEPEEAKAPNPKFIMLLQTIIIGEMVGLFFLTLTHHPLKYSILFYNAAILLTASLGCSGLTLLNVWLSKKTHIEFRVIVQAVTLVVSIVLAKLSFREEVGVSRGYFDTPMYFFFFTVVVALATMLFNVIRRKEREKIELDFSRYLILVIVVGLAIGTGLYVTSRWFF